MSFFTIKSLKHGMEVSAIVETDIEIALTLSKDGQYFGATWFLGALFVVSILYKIIDTWINESKYKDVMLLIFAGILAFISFQVTFPHMLSRTIICGFYFALGVFVKRNGKELKDLSCFGTAFVSGIIYLLISYYGSANMGKNQYRFPLQFVIGAILASYTILYVCKEFDLRAKLLIPVKKFLMFLGRHSIDIVIWQFNAFRLVILFQMYLNKEEITFANLLSYYPFYSTTNGWWVVYSVVGLLAPILFCEILRFGPWGKLFRKIHIV